ncbi:hypothetical protein GUJ93_ZPchr0001g30464 [Zizania palustris]|uniref:Uncharacterized protein n=1 Tax=Zizania palustris TaxID=103762 RepID=A0A8J5RMN8_ZIZPA|nr:hypothetical protein GUJ93_ZPchr0001g30464 [Zizania palustris]
MCGRNVHAACASVLRQWLVVSCASSRAAQYALALYQMGDHVSCAWSAKKAQSTRSDAPRKSQRLERFHAKNRDDGDRSHANRPALVKRTKTSDGSLKCWSADDARMNREWNF